MKKLKLIIDWVVIIKKNHPHYNEGSKINRAQWRQQKKNYWKNEWDSGRWK